MDYLKQFIHTICQAIPFCGSLVNTVIVDNESFDIVVFRKGNGYPCLNCTTPGFLKASGSLLGKIHSASIQAGKERFHFKRKNWYEMDFFNLDTEKFILAAGKENYEYYQSIINEIKKLPTNKNNYGMIHEDFGVNNLFRDWDDLWVFDFGDCCYSFYIYDICTILSSLYMTLNKNNDLKSFSKYAKEFRSAYEKDNKLPKEEWKSERAKLFIQLRLISNLSILLKHINKDSDAYKYVSIHIDAIEKIKNTSAIDLFLGEYI